MNNRNEQKSNQNVFEMREDRPRILIDQELIIDILFYRKSPSLEDKILLYKLVLSKEIVGYITDRTLLEIYYLSNKVKQKQDVIKIVNELLDSFIICKVELDVNLAEQVYASSFTDVHSKIQVISLLEEDIDAIISEEPNEYLEKFARDIKRNDIEKINVIPPSTFLDWYDMLEEDENLSLDEYLDKTRFGKIIESLERELETDTSNDNPFDKNIQVCDHELEKFEVYCSQERYARGKVTLKDTKGKRKAEYAYGKGPIDAICRALDQVISPYLSYRSDRRDLNSYLPHFIKLESISRSLDAPVSAIAILKYNNQFYLGEKTHTDTIKAAFYAYAQAANNICTNKAISPQDLAKSTVAILAQQADIKGDFSRVDLSGESFTKVNWYEADLNKVNLSNSRIHESDLRKAHLCEAILTSAIISYTDLSEANLKEAILIEAKLIETVLDGANLFCADLRKANLHAARLRAAKLNKVKLNEANLSYADLSDANLDNADLSKANLSRANLSRADFTEADLSRADLSGADLSEVIFKKAVLIEANLTGANLTNANLSGADLTGANLTNANLSGLDFRKTKIEGANLCQADLNSADLSGVNLYKTIIYGTLLNGTKMPDGEIHRGIRSIALEMRDTPYFSIA